MHRALKGVVVVGFGAAAVLNGAAATAATEAEGLAAVKAFALDHTAALIARAEELQQTLEGYAAIVARHGGDYARAWAVEGDALAGAVATLRRQWLAASNEYETIEGIVAGLPATAVHDLILDAGNPGGAADDVADYDLTLPDGTVLHQPGSLFHSITEPLFWGMEPGGIALAVDFDGDGQSGRGEVLFDANLGLGAARALVERAAALDADMAAWQPNRDDAFTAVVTMTPTVGDYFAEWKASQYLGGGGSAFVAQSRLIDVLGIIGGCQRMYVAAISPVIAAGDPALDAAITGGFAELLGLIAETRDREAAGDAFSVEEADALGAEAQDMAERIVAQVLQAAARHGVEIRL